MGAAITLIYNAKKKESAYTSEENDYYNRIKRYSSIERIHLKPVKNGAKYDIPSLLDKESKAYEPHISPQSYLILLDEKGKQCSSVEFSQMLQKIRNHNPNITFAIGSAYGFGQSMYERADQKISFSNMTFPHELARLMLVEQLYRAFTILNNENYHHI